MTEDTVRWHDLTPEHQEYVEARMASLAAQSAGPMTASAMRWREWVAACWERWQARRIIDSLPKE